MGEVREGRVRVPLSLSWLGAGGVGGTNVLVLARRRCEGTPVLVRERDGEGWCGDTNVLGRGRLGERRVILTGVSLSPGEQTN